MWPPLCVLVAEAGLRNRAEGHGESLNRDLNSMAAEQDKLVLEQVGAGSSETALVLDMRDFNVPERGVALGAPGPQIITGRHVTHCFS